MVYFSSNLEFAWHGRHVRNILFARDRAKFNDWYASVILPVTIIAFLQILALPLELFPTEFELEFSFGILADGLRNRRSRWSVSRICGGRSGRRGCRSDSRFCGGHSGRRRCRSTSRPNAVR